MTDLVRSGQVVFGHRTPAELEAKLEKVDALIASIRANGYLYSERLKEEKSRWYGSISVPDEIMVNIGRNSELLWYSRGRHRLSVAKVLGVPSIPVVVRARHKQWQAIRDEIRSVDNRADLSEKARMHLDHPDLTDIVPRKWLTARTL